MESPIEDGRFSASENVVQIEGWGNECSTVVGRGEGRGWTELLRQVVEFVFVEGFA